MKGKFIVLEGIDGSGKSTQMLNLSKYIYQLSKDNDVLLTREPTRHFRSSLRDTMKLSTNENDNAGLFSKVFVEDRKKHLKDLIEPNLSQGVHVICDRYKMSTLAYQSNQGIDLNLLVQRHEGMLIPDLTILLDCSVDKTKSRRQAHEQEEVFDRASFEWTEKLRRTYLSLAKYELSSENIVVIDTSDNNPSEVFNLIIPHLLNLFKH